MKLKFLFGLISVLFLFIFFYEPEEVQSTKLKPLESRPQYQRDLISFSIQSHNFIKEIKDKKSLKYCSEIKFLREEYSLISTRDISIKGKKWQEARDGITKLQRLLTQIVQIKTRNNTQDCIIEEQKFIVDLRYLIDTLYVWENDLFTKMKSIGWKDDYLKKDSSLNGMNPIATINHLPEGIDFQSGDVLILLDDFISSFLSHVSYHANPFSHSVILNKMGDSEPLKIIDSLYEYDARVRAFDPKQFLNKHSRVAHFRFKDPGMAHNASVWLNEEITRLKEKNIKLKFDLYMVDGNDEFSCIELIQHGFKKVSENKVIIPIRPAVMSDRKRVIWNYILKGKAPKLVYIPSSIEWDERFTFLREYRNLETIVQGLVLEVITRKLVDITTSNSFRLVYKIMSLRYQEFNQRAKNIHITKSLLRRAFNVLLVKVVAYIESKKVQNGFGPSYYQLRRYTNNLSLGPLEIKSLFDNKDANLYQTLKAKETD